MTSSTLQYLDDLRRMVADVLEIEPEELGADDDLAGEHGADSLQAIEILASIEKAYDVEIPQEELAKMTTLRAVYDVVKTHAGGQD
jgi:acyl carrier protein